MERICDFHGLIGNCKTFPLKSLVWLCDITTQCIPMEPQIFSSKLLLSFITTKFLYLEQFAIIQYVNLLCKGGGTSPAGPDHFSKKVQSSFHLTKNQMCG